jgi:hypothetical protein
MTRRRARKKSLIRIDPSFPRKVDAALLDRAELGRAPDPKPFGGATIVR